MSEEAVLSELKHMRNDFQKLDKRMAGIESTLNTVAVQSQQINTLDRDVGKLWDIKDECTKDMIEIKRFQSSCPRETIQRDFEGIKKDTQESIKALASNTRETLRNQWVAIGILATALIATGIWRVVT